MIKKIIKKTDKGKQTKNTKQNKTKQNKKKTRKIKNINSEFACIWVFISESSDKNDVFALIMNRVITTKTTKYTPR